MLRIEGYSERNAARSVSIYRSVDTEKVRIDVHHPKSGEGCRADVPKDDLAHHVDGILAGERVEMTSLDRQTIVLFYQEDRPDWLNIWVHPVHLDSARRGGNGWSIRVPRQELADILRSETR